MEANQYSRTALVTAYIRAYHASYDSHPIFNDFLAHRLLTEQDYRSLGPSLVDRAQAGEPVFVGSGPGQVTALKWWIKVVAGAILARAHYAEDCLEQVVRNGYRQYVILGAGMDTFAFRRPDLLKQFRVYEIDHPMTQALKRERLAEAGLKLPQELHFIPVDLTRENLAVALARSSYDPKALTIFSWLGVTFYLNREDIFTTFNTMRDLAPVGSAIVFDYLDSGFFSPENPHKSVHLVLDKVRQIGEPMHTGFKSSELAVQLASRGFLLRQDLDPADIERRYFLGRTDGYHAGQYIHFAWAISV